MIARIQNLTTEESNKIIDVLTPIICDFSYNKIIYIHSFIDKKTTHIIYGCENDKNHYNSLKLKLVSLGCRNIRYVSNKKYMSICFDATNMNTTNHIKKYNVLNDIKNKYSILNTPKIKYTNNKFIISNVHFYDNINNKEYIKTLLNSNGFINFSIIKTGIDNLTSAEINNIIFYT